MGAGHRSRRSGDRGAAAEEHSESARQRRVGYEDRMRRLALLLLIALPGCPPSKTPQKTAGTEKQRDPDWWRGTWQIDVERLVDEAKRDNLSPDAQRIVAALATQAATQYRYELSADGMHRTTPRSDDIVPITVRVMNADVVRIEAGSAGRLRLRRTAAGVSLTDNDKTFPVRRAEKR